MDDVVPDDGVDGGMQLDPSDFGTFEFPLVPNVVDMVVFDDAENSPQVPDDAGLPAVVYDVVSDDVASYVVLVPAVVQCPEDHFLLALVANLGEYGRPLVLACALFFPKADAGAAGIADDVVLDHPSLAPVGTYQTFLQSGRRCPLGGGMLHDESADRDVVAAGILRPEAETAHIYLDIPVPGVFPVEVGINGGIAVVNFNIPFVYGELRLQ